MCVTAAGAAAESAAGQAEEELAGRSGPAELDEFGRDVNLMKHKEAEARTQRRRERAQRELDRFSREQVRLPGSVEPTIAAEFLKLVPLFSVAMQNRFTLCSLEGVFV